MAKSILVERNGSTLSYNDKVSKKNPKALGHLEGIAAQYNSPTRNGRRYPKELWEKVVKSDDFKEMMETMTCFCENDHPADSTDRIETSIKEISAVLTNLDISDDGNVYAGFDILDTPQGHILKSLAEYGCSIGVSSRGLGDEIQKDGEIIIDPETFQFFAFDMVVMPAVKAARPSVTESKKHNRQKQSLAKTFAKEVELASSTAELKSLKRVVSNLPGLDSIKESIDNKLNSVQDGEDISSVLEQELGSLSDENVRLCEEINALKSKLSANNIRVQRLKKSNDDYKKAVKSLRENLQEKMVENSHLQTEMYNGAIETENAVNSANHIKENLAKSNKVAVMQKKDYNAKLSECDNLKVQLESVKAELSKTKKELITVKTKYLEKRDEVISTSAKLTESHRKLQNDNRKLCEVKQNSNSEILELQKNIDCLTEERDKALSNLESSQSAVRKFAEENKMLKTKITESEELVKDLSDSIKSLKASDRKLRENISKTTSKQVLIEEKSSKQISSYKKALAEKTATATEILSEYLTVKCAQNGLKVETVKTLLPKEYTLQDINRVVEELADRKRRYDTLSFVVPNNTAKVVESMSEIRNMSPEDKQTMVFLESACK